MDQDKKIHRVCGVDYPKDVVMVHGWPRGPYAPNMGNMVMKLETYLRIAHIPYQVVLTKDPFSSSPTGKMPWIEYNNTVIADSELIIAFLNKEFNVNLQSNLSLEQQTHARALQRWMDESFYWHPVYFRWVRLIDDWYPHAIPQVGPDSKEFLKNRIQEQGYCQGIARHSKEGAEKIAMDDLQALSNVLGDKPFFFGEEPILADCAVFGEVGQVKWHMPDSYPPKHRVSELRNLDQFMDRIKTRYWPDWDDCLDPVKTACDTVLLK